MARQKLLISTLFFVLINVFVTVKCSFLDKTLHIYDDSAHTYENRRTFVFNAGDEIPSYHDRERRSVPTTTSNTKQNITVKINTLNDRHKQLMVHWVGEQTDVIICLAREPNQRLTGLKTEPSAVYISYNYGDSYENKTDSFKINDTTYASVDKFYNHPKYNTHFVFTDTKNKLLFTTSNHGKIITKIQLEFEPSDVSFHEYKPLTFVALDKNDPERRLWLTEDFGKTWNVAQQYVASFFWHSISSSADDMQLYVQRNEPTGTSSVLASKNLFKTGTQQTIIAEGVKDFQIKGDFIFITKKDKVNLDLFISYKGGPPVRCIFDSELDRREYHIADVTGTRVMVAVSHTDKLSHLYVSEGIGNSDPIRFTLSLEGVFCYFPNSTWKDSWLSHISEDPFADVYKVEGLTGIYIASQVVSKVYSQNIGPQHLISVITYDHGGTWQSLNAPKFDDEGQPTCVGETNCSLHLSQKFSQLYPDTRTPSIMSSKSAPGIILATGVIGKSLKGHYGVYISTDAGITWRLALKDFYFFNMGDHGGILIAVKYFKISGQTRHIMYSTDEGEKWIEQPFHHEDLKLYGLMTEPGENTTVFTMFGSAPEEHQWVIIKLDMRSVFTYDCKPEDYKLWSPSQSEGHRLVPCVMGMQQTFERRIPHTNCYNGKDYDRPVKLEACICDAEDYECDFGFTHSGRPAQCIRNKSLGYDPYAIPKKCQPGKFYNRTKGYRKIEGDACKDGFSYLYEPDSLPCPIKEQEEFLVVAQREKINRVNLVNKEIQEIPVHGLRNVIAIDFDMKNNCLYWADIVTDTIGRQCYNNGNNPEILVESNLQSIEGMALDWISNILYFVDGMRAKIEVISTKVRHMGRLRRTIIDSDKLKKPRGIAVHPLSGYIFWTDWTPGEPSVSRANMDGTDIKRLFDKSVVEWPNGISIDHIAERIYWVDAKDDYIASSDLHGRGFKKVLFNDERVSHPFAVAVFKDTMYWDDWKQNGIFSADKDHGVGIQTIKESLPGLMDLKVFAHSIQEGTNACSSNTTNNCEFICVGAPRGGHVCLCPDGMEMQNEKCVCPGGLPLNNKFSCPKSGNSCGPNHFTCKNGNCVPKLWTCDGEDDCGDNSDEQKCESTTCKSNMFTCGDGKCIPQYWRCDFEKDCADNSDELDCKNEKCNDTQFSCKNGKCVPGKWQCDGENDCGDNSDEEDCVAKAPVTCKATEFNCKTGPIKCIPSHWYCDGETDCQDKSDEANCTKNQCADWQFYCASDNHCIYKNWLCDGDPDCTDRSDEVNCTNTTPIPQTPSKPTNSCHDWMFMCQNSKCIPYWWKCDSVNDCGDGSDELGCAISNNVTEAPIRTTQPPVCGDNQFQCFNGVCLLESWVCDGTSDCTQGEDEAFCEHIKNCTEKEFKCKQNGNCVPLSVVCDKVEDCSDGSDEYCSDNDNNNPQAPTVSCSVGYFPCDLTRCYPESALCDGKQDCYDGFDESDCSNNKTADRVYQVLQMGVDERGINSTSLLLYWWIPIPQNVKFEFMPSIKKTRSSTPWKNHTKWIEHSEFRFTGLDPFTEYNMTVYVQVKGQTKVSPPAKYFTATTGEGVPTEPLKVNVEQKNGSHILVKWDPPAYPQGEIVDYEICWAPPIPPKKQRLHSNKTTYLLTADFQPDVEYSFWVVAHNHLHESKSSDVRKLIFDGNSNIDIINDLKVVSKTNGSVTLSWKAVNGSEAYMVTPEAREPYPKYEPITTKTNTITVDGLSPGIYYAFKVKAYKKNFVGQESSITVLTDGERLPEVPNVVAKLFKSSGTTVKISWDAPKDIRKVKWQYGIYYALSAPDLLKRAPQNTTNQTAIVQNLEACEEYIFSVGVIGPLGKGPLSRNLPLVMTHMNPKAPPKRLTVKQDGQDATSMLVQWNSSCPVLKTPIAYMINIRELTLNQNMSFYYNETSKEDLSQSIKINLGGKYEVTVQTYAEDSIPTKPVIYDAPPILPPHQVQIWPETNGSYVIFWQEKNLPISLKNGTKYKYVVLVSEGKHLNETTAQKYMVDSPPFTLSNVSDGQIYTVAVFLQTEDGFKSLLSEVNNIEVPRGSWSQVLTPSSMVGVIVPMILVLVILAAVLVFFVIRHRRLQQSFVRFANSHYDTRSGATTFGGDGLGEDDSPNIRGFSDDEPLVIA